MIGEDFSEYDGWAVPNYMDGRLPYSQPGRNFMYVVEWVLRSVGEPHRCVAPVTHRIWNLHAVRDSGPRLALVLF